MSRKPSRPQTMLCTNPQCQRYQRIIAPRNDDEQLRCPECGVILRSSRRKGELPKELRQ